MILPAWGDDSVAADHYARGSKLLASADFEEALAAFEQAAKAGPENIDYRNEYALLRRILKLRQGLEAEDDPIRRQQTSSALRAYYYRYALRDEAVALDRDNHRRLNSPASAALLAESLLQVGQNAEAANLLAARNPDDLSLLGHLLHGIALARQNQLEPARAIARSVTLPGDASADLLFHMARLRALTEDYTRSLALLTRTLEAVPGSRSAEVRARIKACSDFSELSGETRFTKMLATQSQQAESSCSSGKSCGACPSRSSCSSGSPFDK